MERKILFCCLLSYYVFCQFADINMRKVRNKKTQSKDKKMWRFNKLRNLRQLRQPLRKLEWAWELQHRRHTCQNRRTFYFHVIWCSLARSASTIKMKNKENKTVYNSFYNLVPQVFLEMKFTEKLKKKIENLNYFHFPHFPLLRELFSQEYFCVCWAHHNTPSPYSVY